VFQQLRGARPLYPWCGFPTDRTLQFATTNEAAALGLDDTMLPAMCGERDEHHAGTLSP